MEIQKKILVIAKDKDIERELSDLVLAFDTPVQSQLPVEFDQYDAIFLTTIPENIADLKTNYETPVFAGKSLADALTKGGHTAYVHILPDHDYVKEIAEFVFERERIQSTWRGLRNNLKLHYQDIRPKIKETMEQEKIAQFAAFYRYIEHSKGAALDREVSDAFNRARIALIKYLEAYEENINTPVGEYFRGRAEQTLGDYLDHANKRSQALKNLLNLVGTTSEPGSRYLYLDLKEAEKRDTPEFSFLKEIRTKEGIPHDVIARIVYEDTRYFSRSERKSELRLPASKPPIQHKGNSYLVREGIIGPDLEDVLQFIRKTITRDTSARLSWLHKVRELFVFATFQDLAYWQREAPPITNPTVPATPESIIQHVIGRLNTAFEKFAAYVPTTDEERELWNRIVSAFNANDLQLHKDKITRHFAASTTNIKVLTGKPKIDDIEDLEGIVGAKSSQLLRPEHHRKKIREHFYYVDTGFTFMQEDEDFCHIASSLALFDEGMTTQDKIGRMENYYARFNTFRGRGRAKPSTVSYYLWGLYRNFVSAFLAVNKAELDQRVQRLKAKLSHRLGLAEGLCEKGIAFIEQRHRIPVREWDARPDAIYGRLMTSEAHMPKASGEQRNILAYERTRDRLMGFQYFIKKFEKLKPSQIISSR